MPRSWRTVFRSRNKRVMVRPGEPQPSAPKAPDTSGDTLWVVKSLLAMLGVYLLIEMVIAFWPWLLLGGLGWLVYALFFAKHK